MRRSSQAPSFTPTSGLDTPASTRGRDHRTIKHIEGYVEGRVHTLRLDIDNFWALLKRGLNGTYVSVQPFHLFPYLDERVFMANLRNLIDAARSGRPCQPSRDGD